MTEYHTGLDFNGCEHRLQQARLHIKAIICSHLHEAMHGCCHAWES